MIELEYEASIKESAQATLDFLLNRPLFKFLYSTMKGCCLILCAAFAICLYSGSIRIQDMIAAFFALAWILFYKQFNHWLIKSALKLKNNSQQKCSCKIDDKSILFKTNNNISHIEWKKLKFVLKSAAGYIIPLTGLNNGGRFIWLPKRCIENHEQDFLNLLSKYNLKLNQIK